MKKYESLVVNIIRIYNDIVTESGNGATGAINEKFSDISDWYQGV